MESRHRHCHCHPDLHPRAATESSSCCCCCVWSSSNFPLIIAVFYQPIFELKSQTFSLFKWPQQDEGDFVWSVGHHHHSFLVPLLPITSFSESAKKFIHTHNQLLLPFSIFCALFLSNYYVRLDVIDEITITLHFLSLAAAEAHISSTIPLTDQTPAANQSVLFISSINGGHSLPVISADVGAEMPLQTSLTVTTIVATEPAAFLLVSSLSVVVVAAAAATSDVFRPSAPADSTTTEAVISTTMMMPIAFDSAKHYNNSSRSNNGIAQHPLTMPTLLNPSSNDHRILK